LGRVSFGEFRQCCKFERILYSVTDLIFIDALPSAKSNRSWRASNTDDLHDGIHDARVFAGHESQAWLVGHYNPPARYPTSPTLETPSEPEHDS
jgi:hypothetical protein